MREVLIWALVIYVSATAGMLTSVGKAVMRPRVAIFLVAWPILLPWWAFRNWLRLT